MSARVFTFGGSVLDITDTAVVGLSIPITLVVPGNVPAVDIDSKTVLPDTITDVVTDGSGNYTTPLIYPGDISPPGCVYQIQEGSRTILSPVDFTYSSSIASWQWYAGGGAAGTLSCFIKMVLGNDSPVTGRYAHIAPQQNTVAPDSSLLSVGNTIDALLDGTGTARFWLWPSGGLSPTTLYTCRIDGETTRFSFSVPATPTGYQGAYAGGTTYHVHDGTAYQGPYTPLLNPPDVVLYNGLYYVAIADTTGNLPTNTTYWAPWLGENILWHTQPFGASQSPVVLPSAVAHDSGLPSPVAGAPWPTPANFAQDAENLAYAASHATVGPATSSALGGVELDHNPVSGNPIAVTVPSVGAASGVAALDSGSHVPVAQLPLATPSAAGVVQPDATTVVVNGGVLSARGSATPPARFWKQAVSAAVPSAGSPVTVISNSAYNAFPGLTVSRSGTLFAAYRAGNTHLSTDGVVTTQTSTDGGNTWNAAVAILASGGGHAYFDCNIVTTLTGRLILTTMDQPGGSIAVAGLVPLISDNDGTTWSSPTFLTAFTAGSCCSGAILQHSSGALIWPVYGQNSGDTTWRCGVLRSTNNGTSWSATITIGAANTGFTETSLVELPDSSILAFIRHEGSSTNNLYTSSSTDGGLTWSTPVSLSAFTVYPGRPAAVLVPVSQLLILFYRSTSGEHAVYRYSADLGVTWSGEQLYSSSTYVYSAGVALAENIVGFVTAVETSSSVASITFCPLTAGSGAGYTLPAASTTVLGGVKVDGVTASVTGGVLTILGSGGGSGGSGELLVQDGVTAPPVALYLDDGSDFIWQG